MAIDTPKKRNFIFYTSIFFVGALLVGGAIFFGKTDKGQIDVSAAIANSNAERQAESEATGEAATYTPPPRVSSEPNGGLVGKGSTETPPPVETPPADTSASTTATSTAATTATTTTESASDTVLDTAPATEGESPDASSDAPDTPSTSGE